MVLFGWMAIFSLLVMALGRLLRRPAMEEEARNAMKVPFVGARAVATEVFGSLGGQATFDPGPPPPPTMEPPPEHHERWEEPPQRP